MLEMTFDCILDIFMIMLGGGLLIWFKSAVLACSSVLLLWAFVVMTL